MNNRPLEDVRPFGPFKRLGSCSITFKVMMEVEDDNQLKTAQEEILDSIKVRLNIQTEDMLNVRAIEDVKVQNTSSETYKFIIKTNLDRFTSTLEDVIIKEIRQELIRVTDGQVTEKDYEFTV